MPRIRECEKKHQPNYEQSVTLRPVRPVRPEALPHLVRPTFPPLGNGTQRVDLDQTTPKPKRRPRPADGRSTFPSKTLASLTRSGK